jgi:hypothetical protein
MGIEWLSCNVTEVWRWDGGFKHVEIKIIYTNSEKEDTLERTWQQLTDRLDVSLATTELISVVLP